MGNAGDGIRISQGPKYTSIGGTPNEANEIANNGGNGVYIMFANDDNHLISCNSIYNNAGLGIDLFPPGVNLNDFGDLDSGPNEEMNFPDIDTVIYLPNSSETIIQGSLETLNPEFCTVQIYRAIPDATGHGEGAEYLSSSTPDATGYWIDTLSGLTASDFLTTLAIDPNNNTSEFSISRNTTTIATGLVNLSDERILIFPNPTKGKFYVCGKRIDFIEVLDVKGQVIESVHPNSAHTSIDISGETPGLYFIQVFIRGRIFTEKVLLR